ncbi:MAG: hypothetical protein L3J54_05015, partial [Draconibacterium sp.]|nr:hypothetical protein [Draconibacterium sp.]
MTKNIDKKDDLLAKALERFELAKVYFEEDYRRNERDNSFALGEQWDSDVKSERLSEGRPCLVENRLLPFINKTVNEIRQARPSVIVKP